MNNLPNPRKPTHNKTLGIEIECVIDREVADKITTPYHGMFKVDTDGSIRAGYNKRGKELVSQPLPASWLKNEITKLYKKFKWEHDESCGIHVHVSRKWWSVQRAEKLARFLGRLSRADMKLLFGREPNEFCQNNGYRPNNRYNAINFTPENTIEIRAFSSGDAEWAKYCVAFTDLLVRHRGDYTYADLLRMKAEASGQPVAPPLAADTQNNDRPIGTIADAGGWIEWTYESPNGPLTPDTMVQVRLRESAYQAENGQLPVSSWRWTRMNSCGDIVAYRPVPQPAP